MLLPSDVARLVLGYLQQEGLTATCRAFILESPNLREYAEHTSEDGAIPACVFSLFGKNLTTILNEYVAVKAKETCQENQIPAMMTSLWKRLDFTLNQIKSMQNSPAVQQIQRLRTQNSIQNMRRQRALSASLSSSTVCLSVSTPGNCVSSPIPAPQGMLGHSTPVCYTSQQTRPSTVSLSQPGDSTLQIILPDHRFTPGPLSPARRKCDSPRRRSGGQFGTSRGTVVSSTLNVESQSQETVTENLSQMVIENAREKILNDRSLQEKLAENINKILASDNSPQISKAACSTVEQEQSIDEILGLQGEIHMTDDAIQDILEQTESDPAFQALFDLFDYGKSKTAEGSEQTDGNLSNSAQESDETGHADSATGTGTGHEDSTSGAESTTRKLRSKTIQETKSKRKSSLPLSTGRPVPEASQSHLLTKRTTCAKKGTSRNKVSVSSKQAKATSLTPRGQVNKKADSESSDQNTSSCSLSEEGMSMEVDEPTREKSVASSPQKITQPVLQESSQTTEVTSDRSRKKVSVSNNQGEPTPSVGADASGLQKEKAAEKAAKQNTGTQGGLEASGQSTDEPSHHRLTHITNVPSKTSSQQPATNKVPVLGTQEKDAKPSSPRGTSSEPLTLVTPCSAVTSTPSATVHVSQSQTTEPDPNKIVALKIIISDEHEEQNSDSALNQAVSSISGDCIPTIFLSSPAKSPAKILPVPTSSITPEETAQAVSSLQGAEAAGAPTINSSQLSQARLQNVAGQEAGFIQLLPASATFGGQSSYFVVTDPAATVDQHSGMMLLPSSAAQGATTCASQLVATPPRSRAVVTMAANAPQTFSPASAIIISSPVQPMIQNMAVPVSVFGQNNTGKFTVLSNQMLALPGPTLMNQPAKVVSKSKLLPKDNVELGKVVTPGSGQVSNPSQSLEQLKSSTGVSPGHRRILCFDENTDQTNKTSNTTTATASPGVKERTRTDRIQPSLLASSGAKKRVETVRSPEPSHSLGTKEKASVHQQQTEPKKSAEKEMGTDMAANISTSSTSATQQDPSVRSESRQRSQLTSNTEDGPTVSADTAQSLKSSPQSIRHKSSTVMKNTSQEESHERRPPNTPEVPSESSSSQDSPGITANKENEVGRRELHQATAENFVSSTVRPSTPASQGVSGKPICKTSPLTKQAAEMLQDIQSQSPTATTPRRKGVGCSDLPLPRTPGLGRLQEDYLDGLRTPSKQRLGREAEGTPKHLVPPATPDIPSCSPASEAGSENSINMAAHTLMILSRAARTGGPLKDSLRQEEAAAAKSSAFKGKKRKHTEPSPTTKKELPLSGSSGSKKKAKKQKKLLDSFPHDLDVDKFLSSLHYDE
ncbi:LOW QUALITY PROTEIN: protein NPAT [Colossoma macropomum]|uniref:LOW QUALITY PROTEIN: protein NPAT n=1 Tax=Colossoma macropomum TaxID=42526 RepID=UPI0018653A6D|nr:LOW QUALITY PROTEIN: protein NPAT [Colossoma macropomum]